MGGEGTHALYPVTDQTFPFLSCCGQAERQAVNTTVQGSAADLVKTAMVRIDAALREMFPDCHLTHRHRIESLLGESWMSGVVGGG